MSAEFAVELSDCDDAQRESDYSDGLHLIARASGVRSREDFDSLMFEVCNAIANYRLGAGPEGALPSESAIRLAEERIMSQLGDVAQSAMVAVQEVTVDDPARYRMHRVPC